MNTWIRLIVYCYTLLFFSSAHALVEPNWPMGTPNTCSTPSDGFIDFESGADGDEVQSNIPGTTFSTTDGFEWLYADWRTGLYNGPYPNGSYTSNGNFMVWLGPSQGQGRIDFTEGAASYVSLLTSTYSGLIIDAYDSAGALIASSGMAGSNVSTGTMTRLTVEAPAGASISYIMVHDAGNYWIIDDLCTDAKGVPPAYAAIADLAKDVIGAKYLWGGKGYDFTSGAGYFLSANDVKSNYSYWNAYKTPQAGIDIGTGLDCSGLNMWAFNRLIYGDQKVNWGTCISTTSANNCPVFYERADNQWRSNSTKNTGAPSDADLQIGDLLFFNTLNKKDANGGPIMDHVAMYVGPFEFALGNIANVVHASGWSKTDAVVPAWYDSASAELVTDSAINDGTLPQRLKVTGWGRISDPRIDAWVISHSPIRLSVTDPEGITVNLSNTLADTEGYSNEVPGMSYMVKDIDGIAEDTVAISALKPGAYFIQVSPKLDALPEDTYSLEVRFPDIGADTIWLANDEPVNNKLYVIESSSSGIFQSTKVKLVIKPTDTVPRINPKSKGNIPIVIMGSKSNSVDTIYVATVQLDDDSNRDTNGIAPDKWSLKDVNHDGYYDFVMHFKTESLKSANLLDDLKQLYVTANLSDDTSIIGYDVVHLVGGLKYQ